MTASQVGETGRWVVVEADGVEDEFRYAREAGLALIPIGATGAVSKRLWQEVFDNFATRFPRAGPTLRKHFSVLGHADAAPAQLVAAVVAIIRILRKEQ